MPRWLRDLRSLPSCPAVLAAGGREHEIAISLEDFVRAGNDPSRAPGRGGAGPRGGGTAAAGALRPRVASAGPLRPPARALGPRGLRAALRRGGARGPAPPPAHPARRGRAALRHPPSRLGFRPRGIGAGAARGPAAHAPGARRGRAPPGPRRPHPRQDAAAGPARPRAPPRRHRPAPLLPPVLGRRRRAGGPCLGRDLPERRARDRAGEGPRRGPPAPGHTGRGAAARGPRCSQKRHEGTQAEGRGLRAVLHGLHLLRLRGHHPALHDPEQRPVSPGRRRARPVAGGDEPARAGGAGGPGQPGGAAEHLRRRAPGQRHHGRPLDAPDRGGEAVAGRARHLRGADDRAAGAQQQAAGRPALAGGRGQAALRRPAQPRGPGRQGALVRRRRRPPVPHRPQGRGQPHPAAGGRVGQHARGHHRERRAPAPPARAGPDPRRQVAAGGARGRLADHPAPPRRRGSSSTRSTSQARAVLPGTEGTWLEARDRASPRPRPRQPPLHRAPGRHQPRERLCRRRAG